MYCAQPSAVSGVDRTCPAGVRPRGEPLPIPRCVESHSTRARILRLHQVGSVGAIEQSNSML